MSEFNEGDRVRFDWTRTEAEAEEEGYGDVGWFRGTGVVTGSDDLFGFIHVRVDLDTLDTSDTNEPDPGWLEEPIGLFYESELVKL